MDPVAIVQVQELECCKMTVSDDTAKTNWDRCGTIDHTK